MTPVTKFVLPGGFLATLPIWLSAASDQRFGWIPAFAWAGTCVGLVWWTLPIKKVVLVGETFHISNYFREIEVPTDQLKRIAENPANRTPNITLFFEPSTAFGRKVRIVPPIELSSDEGFERVARVLRDIVSVNRGAEMDARRKTMSVEVSAIVANPTLEKTPAITALGDSDLNELIDRLPGDSELRDLARRERQKRWYS
jgi:hypothetical protein